MKKQCRGIDNDTGIIIDDSDIIKSKAKKMEGLKKVRDGSTGRYDQSGYNLLNIIAFQDNGEGYEIKPISSDLISRDLEMDSISQTLEDRLVDIAITVNGKGVYIGDRGLDTRKFFSFLKQHGLNFIVRLTGKRSLIVDGNELKFIEVAKSVKFTHWFKLKGSNRQIRCGIKRVELRTDPHPKKNPETIEAWLIICRFISDEKNKSGFFYFLCDFPNQPHLSKPAIMEKVVKMYGIRWKIEEVHKQVKQDYGWEPRKGLLRGCFRARRSQKIQLTSYTRLKTMNQILLIAVCFLYSLKRYAYLFLEAFPSIMKYCNSRWKKIYDFIYYRLSILVQMCFTSVTKYNINPYAGRWLKSQQLLIPYKKNGGM
ncbi:MAG: transposase [Candidatus Cloacimonetes bacterium]|nr:transposase [Candidatus Cloacimonadota bacterium]